MRRQWQLSRSLFDETLALGLGHYTRPGTISRDAASWAVFTVGLLIALISVPIRFNECDLCILHACAAITNACANAIMADCGDSDCMRFSNESASFWPSTTWVLVKNSCMLSPVSPSPRSETSQRFRAGARTLWRPASTP